MRAADQLKGFTFRRFSFHSMIRLKLRTSARMLRLRYAVPEIQIPVPTFSQPVQSILLPRPNNVPGFQRPPKNNNNKNKQTNTTTTTTKQHNRGLRFFLFLIFYSPLWCTPGHSTVCKTKVVLKCQTPECQCLSLIHI